MPIGRADPASRFRDYFFSTNEHRSPLPARAVIARLSLEGIADDEVIARNMRKTAKVDGIVKAAFAGFKSLVAACGDRKPVADQNGPWHGLPEFDGDCAVAAMVLNLHA